VIDRFLPLMYFYLTAPAQVPAAPAPIILGGGGWGGFVKEHCYPDVLLKGLEAVWKAFQGVDGATKAGGAQQRDDWLTGEGSLKSGGRDESIPSYLDTGQRGLLGQNSVLGVDVGNAAGDHSGVVILNVKGDGLMNEWNQRNPTKQLCPGNVIVEVNGTRGGYWEILRESSAGQGGTPCSSGKR
ncbi:unnamed protein product, partial [Prorocentrum cordatum]